ncbi:MAG: RNA 2',3'-cyclic phosphodiesterase [Planctomycetes bacterium]|nr:RNA 2',3'-cyclic phosphodiesterase [Planctomycetota bacterium]
MRAFLAIDLPDAARDALARAQDDLRRRLGDDQVGWSPRENWHLTLVFLGQVDAPAPVIDAARAVCAASAPLDLALGPLGTFGGRVLWAAVEGPGLAGLVALAGDLARALAPLGIAFDDRPYSPHLTLGRVRDPTKGRRGKPPRGRPPGVAAAVRAAAPPTPVTFRAGEVVLFESRLSPPRPATYLAHAHLPLGAGGGDTRQDHAADPR